MIEQILTYGILLVFIIGVFYYYLRQQKSISATTTQKVAIAKEEGLFEPVSLYPYIDLNTCIGSAACVSACPEKDILGIVNNQATVIQSSNCVGHGACFHACPVEAISLRIGTEKRGVELPHVNQTFESNIKGIFIAGELGGMGLIKNSVEQGQQAVENLIKTKPKSQSGTYDLIIVGAGPAGISATLKAKKEGLNFLTLEQDSIGGTVYSFPRSKIVMTAPMNLPLFGKVKLFDTSKDELLKLWNKVISEHNLVIKEHTKVDQIIPQENGTFKVTTDKGETFITQSVLLAIGRRGTPRKLNVPGEDLPNVAYRLLDPEQISGKHIVVVGGGDSAVESAFLLMDENIVTLSYRKDKFARIKPKNRDRLNKAIEDNSLNILFNSNVISIEPEHIMIAVNDQDEVKRLKNDLTYIFAGGELPTNFLAKAGIEIKKRFGYIMKKHN